MQATSRSVLRTLAALTVIAATTSVAAAQNTGSARSVTDRPRVLIAAHVSRNTTTSQAHEALQTTPSKTDFVTLLALATAMLGTTLQRPRNRAEFRSYLTKSSDRRQLMTG